MINRRVEITAFGGPDVLRLVEGFVLPAPGPEEVRVRVLATGAAFTDVMIRRGKYPDVKATPPFTPGYDMVGRVDACGPGAARFAIGDRVADLTVTGAYADYLCLPEDRLTAVPDGVAPEPAVAAVLAYVTAYQMLHRLAGARPGQSLLIHGAGGAVGSAMLDLARQAGVRAYGTDIVAKHDLIAQKGGVPIDAHADGLEARLADVTGGVDFVFDPLGGDSFARSFRVLKRGGTLVGFGFYNAVLGRGGSVPLDFLKLKLWNLLPNGRRTVFYSIGALRKAHPDWFKAILAVIFGLLAECRIAPAVGKVLPLEQAAEAHRLIEAAAVVGKIVLVTGQTAATSTDQSDRAVPATST